MTAVACCRNYTRRRRRSWKVLESCSSDVA